MPGSVGRNGAAVAAGWVRALWLCPLVLLAVMGGPARAGDGKQIKPAAIETFVDAARASLSPADRADPLAAIRAYRRFAYSNMLFSGGQDGGLNAVLFAKTSDLRSALLSIQSSRSGVWCTGAAVVLARLYEELGYKTQIIAWGSQSRLGHTQVLVQVRGDWYLQDAYFDFDYVDEHGRPLPYTEVLRRFKSGNPASIRQDLDERIGLFSSLKNAAEYVPPLYQNNIDCVKRDEAYACDVTMTVSRFLESWFQRAALEKFLGDAGLPKDRPDYLSLYPTGVWETRRGEPYGQVNAPFLAKLKAITQCWSDGEVLACAPGSRPAAAKAALPATGESQPLPVVWTSLVRDHLDEGTAPVEVVTPPVAYDYGAITLPVTVPADRIIEVSIQVSAGRMGVALATPGGKALISKEQPVTAADGQVKLRFAASRAMGPIAILVRNYDDQGHAGAAKIFEVRSRAVEPGA